MRKIINVIVISFFIVFSINPNFGVALSLPILLILILHNNKNIIIAIPLSVLSMIFFNKEYIYVVIFMYIYLIVFLLIVRKRNKNVIEFVLNFLFMLIIFFLINHNIDIYRVIWFITLSAICTIIYYLLKEMIIVSSGNYYYFEMLSMLVVILSTTIIDFEFKLSLYIAIFYVMYFSINTNKILSYLFSFILTVFLYLFYKNNLVFILPVINSIYIIGNILSSFILIILLLIISIFLPQNLSFTVVVSFICIIFELIRKYCYIEKFNIVKTIDQLKKTSYERLNENVLAFSSFLDGCISDIESLNENEKKIKEGIDNIQKNYCNRCYVRERCYEEFETPELEFKNLIINCNKKNYHIYNNQLISKCPYNIEIRKSALITNSRIDFDNLNKKNTIIKKTFNSVSNILRQYTIENNLKEELDYAEISKIKEGILTCGYDLCYFNLKEVYNENFLIEIGIRGIEYSLVEDKIKLIIKKTFKKNFDIEYSHSDHDKTYINIFNKKNIIIEFSSSNIANGSVSGDNIYINEKGNKFIAAICDGMGKGNKANKESSTVISLFNRLNNACISTYTALNILNSYFQIKEEYDTYSTIDFLEINTQTKKATFYKMSATPSYIFRTNKSIEKIENELLPLGNEEKIEGNQIILSVDDVIVMSSDGLFENYVNEDELNEYISNIVHLPVEKIVLQIINFIKKNNMINEDDISLVVLKILSD